jgi:hypothetical protein
MSLIGNYTVLNKFGRWLAGGTAAFAAGIGSNQSERLSNWQMQSNWLKFGLQDRSGGSGVVVKLASKPNGYYPSGAWALPVTAGSMASYALVNGSGTLTPPNLAGGLNAVATITGAGAITNAGLGLIVSMVATLVGAGAITNANLNAVVGAIATLSGAGNVTAATATGIASPSATLTGSGIISSAVLSANGDMSAFIKSYGDLTPDNLAQYVWNLALEGGVTAEQLMRLMSAALAGKVSGASGTTVTIRDINDTVDRIVATVDTSGDRTAVTLNSN